MTDTHPFGQIELTTVLADYAQVADGKLNVIGAGWDHAAAPFPSAVAGIAHVPYDMANTPFDISFDLVDFDGDPVVPEGADGPLELRIEGASVSANAIAKRGQTLKLPFAFVIGPLPLAPGRYVWRAAVNGRTESRWNLAFSMASAAGLQLS